MPPNRKIDNKADKQLTPAEEAVCAHYVLHGDATAAVKEAYPHVCKWQDKSVWEKASKLVSRAYMQRRISELRQKTAEIAEKKFAVNAEYVLGRHVEIDQMDVADILNDEGGVKPVKDWPKVWRQSISAIDLMEIMSGKGDEREMTGLLKKIKWPDKVTNLEKLGNHVSVNAYRKQVGISDPNGESLKLLTADMDAQEAAQLYKEMLASG